MKKQDSDEYSLDRWKIGNSETHGRKNSGREGQELNLGQSVHLMLNFLVFML